MVRMVMPKGFNVKEQARRPLNMRINI